MQQTNAETWTGSSASSPRMRRSSKSTCCWLLVLSTFSRATRMRDHKWSSQLNFRTAIDRPLERNGSQIPKSRSMGSPGKRRLPKVGDKPAKPRAGEPNKRQQLEALLTGTGPDTGHTWVEGHRSRDNLCITCSTCGFFVEQVDSRVSFDKKSAPHLRVAGTIGSPNGGAPISPNG